MKKGIAGSKESSDCFVTITESDQLVVDIDSTVGAFFYRQIEKVILDTLKEMKLDNVHVSVVDRGALDQTIKARVLVAIERMKDDD